jgi:hypothetical protein
MQNSINEYVSGILATLAAMPLARQPKIEFDDREEVWFIRADIRFMDNSLLHFRELWIWQDDRPFKKAYTYHYQREDETIIFRYDNAPHFPHLPTAPNHKHVGENDVIAANAPDLESVLKEIEKMIKT